MGAWDLERKVRQYRLGGVSGDDVDCNLPVFKRDAAGRRSYLLCVQRKALMKNED